MDLFSHGVWGSIISRKKSIALGFLFGILPDILSLGWYFGSKPYLIAHSLLVVILVLVVTRKVYGTWTYGGAYALHVFLDIFAHGRGTSMLLYIPILWKSYDPIGFHGWNWWKEGRILEIGNWVVLIIIISIISIRKARKKKSNAK